MFSQSASGKAANKVAQYNASVTEYNAKNLDLEVANKNAEFAQGAARERANQDRTLSTIRTQMASSGVQGDTGTSLEIVGDTASAFQLSISDAARQTSMQVAAIRQKQVMMRQEAQMQRYGGTQAQAAGNLAAVGTGLSGAASVFGGISKGILDGAWKSSSPKEP